MIITIIYPVIGLIFCIISFFFLKFNRDIYSVNAVLIAFGFASLAFNYHRLDGTGDIVKYEIVFNYISSSYNYLDIYSDIYNWFYSGWNTILYFVGKNDLPFETINSIFIFTYYLFIISIVIKSSKTKSEFIYLFTLTIFLFSIPFLFTTYRNQVSFAILSYALCFSQRWSKIFLSLLSISIHPASVIILMIYVSSKFFVFKKRMVLLFLAIGLLIKPVIQGLSFILVNIPFVGGKINTYLLGGWADFDLSKSSDILLIINCVFLIASILYSLFIIRIKSMNSQYVNFIFSFICISLLFVSFQTLAQRYILFAYPLYIPLFAAAFNSANINQKIILIMLSFFIIDFRLFTAFSSTSYIIGDGFPSNIINNVFSIYGIEIF